MKLFYKKYNELGSLTSMKHWIKQNHYKSRTNTDFANINRMFCNPVYAMPDENMYNWLITQQSNIFCTKEEFLNVTGIISYGKQYESGPGRGYFKNPF